jgi:hypothetical protein
MTAAGRSPIGQAPAGDSLMDECPVEATELRVMPAPARGLFAA